MKIMFSGGGTLGPVVPLVAIAEIYKKHDPKARFAWVGTKNGPERQLVAGYGIPFYAITSGKLRRYFSLFNISDAFKLCWGFFQSLVLLWQEKPDILISAGGFTSVPLHWAGAALGIPQWIHQQDLQIGLANRLMSRSAKKITTALRDCAAFFPEKKTEWIGNPVRNLEVKNKSDAYRSLGLPAGAPVIFALGGGTGSSSVNKLVLEAVPGLPKDWQIVHLVGRERPSELQERAARTFPNYHVYQFFTEEMKYAYAVADVVVARAGFATITELAALAKPSVLVPMSGTHQEINAKMLVENKAAIVMREKTDNGLKLAHIIRELMAHPEVRDYLGRKLREILPPAPPDKIISIIEDLTS